MSAVFVSSCFSVPPRRWQCCRCNGSAKCLRYACVRNGTPCSHCLPGEAGNCHNTLPRVHLTSATPPSPQTPPSISPPATSGPSSQPSQVTTPSSPPTAWPGAALSAYRPPVLHPHPSARPQGSQRPLGRGAKRLSICSGGGPC